MEAAIAKLRAEMAANKDDSYVQVIGAFLLQHLEGNPASAEKILAADKSILKSLDAMAAEARKKQKNGRAMLTPVEGYSIVLKYFGIDVPLSAIAIAPVAPAAAATVAPPTPPAPTVSKTSFDVDDLLAGL